MSFLELPPLKSRDDLEGLLRAFFRKQMPRTWPPPRVPLAQAIPSGSPTTGRGLIRGRWALAASVALLLLSSLLLPSRFTRDAQPENRLNAPAISSDDIRRKMDQEHKNKPGLAGDADDPLPEMDESDLLFMK